MVCIVEAVPYIAFPKKVKELAQFIPLVPERTLQIVGVVVAFAGIAIIYLGRHLGGI